MRLLDQKEIADLTGFKTATKQARWLTSNRIKFWRNGQGRVVVSDVAVAASISSGYDSQMNQPKLTKFRA